jgi:hypothetical protein
MILYKGHWLVQVTYRKTCKYCNGTGIIENDTVDANDAENAHTFLSLCGAQVLSDKENKSWFMFRVEYRVVMYFV